MGRATAEAHRPRRTCVGCRRVAEPEALVRIARRPDGALEVGGGPGRGAWLCVGPSTGACLDKAVKRRALSRALRASVTDRELSELRARLVTAEQDE